VGFEARLEYVTRDELLRRTNHKTPEQKGWEYLRQLYMMTVIFFVVYFGVLGTVLFWNYPDVAEVKAEILVHVELYLEGEGYFSKPIPTPYEDVAINNGVVAQIATNTELVFLAVDEKTKES
jgi:hypothetical protein